MTRFHQPQTRSWSPSIFLLPFCLQSLVPVILTCLAKHSSYCLSTLWSKSASLESFFFYQKVKTISLYWVNSRRMGRGNDTQIPIQPAWDIAHSSTLWPMNVSKLVQNNAVFFSFIRPQHYCVTHSNTKDTSRDIHGREVLLSWGLAEECITLLCVSNSRF